MQPIATDGLVWSVSLSVWLYVCNNHGPYKHGSASQDAIWDVDLAGSKELFWWSPYPLWEGALLRGWHRDFSICCQARFPVALTSGFHCMLLTSVLIGWSQKQSSVTLNFSN